MHIINIYIKSNLGSKIADLNPFTPLTPIYDQDRFSPHIINAISSRRVMGIKKNVN